MQPHSESTPTQPAAPGPEHPSNQQPIPDSAPTSPHASHRRNGKVARLPAELRDLVNLMLRDGKTYPFIVEKLAARGQQITTDSLSRWHSGGYQDWLQEQAWLEEMRSRLGFATEVIRLSNGALIDAASLRIAVTQMYKLLVHFDPAVLSEKIASHPGTYSRILNSLCKLTEAGIKCQRYRDQSSSARPLLPTPLLPPAPKRGNPQ